MCVCLPKRYTVCLNRRPAKALFLSLFLSEVFLLILFSFFSSWTCAECLKSIIAAAAALGNDGRDDDPKTKAFSFPALLVLNWVGDTVQFLNFLGHTAEFSSDHQRHFKTFNNL